MFPNPYESRRVWKKAPMTNTEPHAQQLVIGPYLERGMGPQGLASVWLSGYMFHSLA